MTMHTLMAEMNLDSIDLLKVDIEGAEKEVFEDCDWMQRVDCLIIELHDRLKPGAARRSTPLHESSRGHSEAR